MIARSTLRYEGPRTGLRDAEPMVNSGATDEGRRVEPLTGRPLVGRQLGSPTRFGRCTPKPANALKLVDLCHRDGHARLQCDERCHGPVVRDRAQQTVELTGASLPAGRSHTTEDTKMCGMSPGRIVAFERSVETVRHGIASPAGPSESTRQTPTKRRPPAWSGCSHGVRQPAQPAAAAGSVPAPDTALSQRCCDTGSPCVLQDTA